MSEEQQEVIFGDESDDTIDFDEEAEKLEDSSDSGSQNDREYVKLAEGQNKLRFLSDGVKRFQKFEKQEDGSYDVTELDEEEAEEVENRRSEVYSSLYNFIEQTDEAENPEELKQVYEEEFTEENVEAIRELLEELEEVESELDKISKQIQFPVELVDGELIAGNNRITSTDDDTEYIYSVTYASTKSSQWGQLVDVAKRKGGLEGETVMIKRDGTGSDTQYSCIDLDTL